MSGVHVRHGGRMVIDGSATTIHHNCIDGESGDYGLEAYDSSSSIHLKSLTKESISTNNGGGGNYGGEGRIITLRPEQEVMSCVDENGRLHVQPGLNSLYI